MNKYLEKIASDLGIAKEYHKDELGDVKKYTDELKDAKNPKLREALKFALPEEKQHAAKFEIAVKNLEKKAVKIHMYVHKDDNKKTKWIAEGKVVPQDYIKTNTSFYKKKGQGKK